MLSFELNYPLPQFTLSASVHELDRHAVILGPSASGKSFLFRLLSGLETPREGFISWRGEKWFDSRGEIALPVQRRSVGLVFQESSLFPHLNVRENLAFSQPEPSRVALLAERFGVSDLLKRRTDRLSGGERQRICLLRALLFPVELLLLDEAFSALNTDLRQFWLTELAAFTKEEEIQLLYITHNPDDLSYLPARAFAMEQGVLSLVSDTFE